jgi:hypothetical protein
MPKWISSHWDGKRIDRRTKEGALEVKEIFMKPTYEWPEGGYLRETNGQVEIATGYFAAIHPDRNPNLTPPTIVFPKWP